MKHTWYDPAAWFATDGTDEDSSDSGFRGCRGAIEICWLAVVFLVPVFFSPIGHQPFYLNKALLLQALVITMLALWLADRIVNRSPYPTIKWRQIVKSPLHISILAFGLVTVIATIASITPALSLRGAYEWQSGLITLLCWIVFFLIVSQHLRRRRQLLRVVYTLLLSSAVVSIAGIAQHYLPGVNTMLHWPATPSRVFATIGNPLSLSSFLAMVIPFTIAVLVFFRQDKEGRSKRRARIIPAALVALLALQLWCLFLAQKSVTMLAFVIGAIVFVTLLGIIQRKRLLLGAGLGMLTALVVLAGLIVAPLLLPAAGGSQDNKGTAAGELGLTTIKYRVEYWQAAVSILRNPPLIPFTDDSLLSLRPLIGYGPETFIITSQGFSFSETISSYSSTPILTGRPHNHYLYLSTTVGLLGLAAFIAVIAVFFRLLFRLLRRVTLSIDRLIIIALMAGMVQYLVDILFNPSLIPAELVFWLMLGMVPALGRLAGQGTKTGAGPTAEAAGTNTGPQSASDIMKRKYLAVGCTSALIVLAAVITARPFLADIEFQKALNYERMHSEQAIFAFDRTTGMAPEQPVYWASMAAYIFNTAPNAIEESVRDRLLAFATDTYEKSLALEPYIAVRNYSLADMYLYRTVNGAVENWPRTLELYERAAQLAPANPAMLDREALALIIKGDFDAARARLEQSASLDPEWAETGFLSGLLLAEEDEPGMALEALTVPLRENPARLTDFANLCPRLALYDTVSPLDDILSASCTETSTDWVPCAMAGVTAFYNSKNADSIAVFDRAMALAPASDVGEVFRVGLVLAGKNTDFEVLLAGAAPAWRAKLARSPGAERWLEAIGEMTTPGL